MIYFDNAATSWPKPPQVLKEVELTMRFRGGNPSRSGHPMAKVAGQVIYRCREKLAAMFKSQPERVVFTPGATYALNYSMKSVIGSGDHFIISNMEHNAVLRTAYSLQKKGAEFDFFDATAPEAQIIQEISSKIRKNTVAVVCLHASNVISLILPIAKIGQLCKRRGILFIVDAAQSAGHCSIHIDEMEIDSLCIPAHKGLLGPQGCGCMIVSEKMANRMQTGRTIVDGGSGIFSMDKEMPTQLPERFEPGTQPTALIAGLYGGLQFVEKLGYEAIEKREHEVYATLRKELMNMDFVTLYMPQLTRGNMLLFNIKGVPTSVVGNYFDKKGVCLRSGFHCSPMAHQKLGTGSEGAVRISLGWNNSKKEAVSFLSMLWNGYKEWSNDLKGKRGTI